MNGKAVSDSKLKNVLQTVVLIICMSLLLALISRLLFGAGLWLWIMLGVIGLMVSLPGISPSWLMHMYRAREISAHQSPVLFSLMAKLSHRADLPRVPRLYWVASETANAFAVGSRANSAIAVTDGLLRRLNLRELSGVVAHEVSHIRNNDLLLMTLADVFTRFTHLLSLAGLLTIVIATPLMLPGLVSISIWGLLLLVISPSISALLQMGLSRVREFDADLDAARLTGDPAGLAMALEKIDQQRPTLLQRVFTADFRSQQPAVLRSHPEPSVRIKRLLALAPGQAGREFA